MLMINRTPFVSAIILAAGQSKRLGRTKQLLVYQGKTLIEWAVDTVLASSVGETIVVIGHEAESIKAVLKDKPVKLVFNPDYARGMSTSLKAGIGKVSSEAHGVLIMLGDQPGLTPVIINELIAAFEAGKGGIIVPVYQGRRGNPVLLGVKYKPELMALSGDVGARQVLAAHPEDVHEVEVACDGILQDVDTEEEFRRLGEWAMGNGG